MSVNTRRTSEHDSKKPMGILGAGGGMSDKQIIKYLLYLFDGSHYAEMFSVVDDKSGIRGAGIRLAKTKDYPNGDEDYKVTINKDILERWLGGEE